MAAPLVLVVVVVVVAWWLATLRGHLGWWAGAGCGPAPGHGHSGHCIDDITIVSWKIVEISPDLTLFSKQTGRFRDLCYFLTKPPFGYDLCVHTAQSIYLPCLTPIEHTVLIDS